MADLVIRGGLVCDGSGREAERAADVAMTDGGSRRSGRVASAGDSEIDAGGLVVAPGFIDLHTHYDCQLFWDPSASPSPWHGVTTVVMGNCGFTVAPCRPGASRDADASAAVRRGHAARGAAGGPAMERGRTIPATWRPSTRRASA